MKVTKEEKEKWFDDEVSDKLCELSVACKEAGLSFLAVVEWDGDRSITKLYQPEASITMHMALFAAHCRDNFDSFYIDLSRWFKEKGISTESSMIFRMVEKQPLSDMSKTT